MRILSLSLRNYRVHRALDIRFSPTTTLIGGPNESGKSTLAEAMHRALFLRSRITGDVQKSMLSHFGGQPEVQVQFESGTQVYDVRKIFSGSAGSCVLTEQGGPTLHGEHAETKLAELLGVAGSVSGNGAMERLRQTWAHLWVWQGSAGENPTGLANTQKDQLLQRLQAQGGMAVAQSDLDARISRYFIDTQEKIFTERGQIRAGTELAKAAHEKDTALALLNAAQANLARLEKAADAYLDAETTLASIKTQLEPLARQLEETRAKRAQVLTLQNAEKLQSMDCAGKRQEYESLQIADAQIRKLRAQIASAETKLKPKRAEWALRNDETKRLRDEESTAKLDYHQALESTRTRRLACDLAQADVICLEKQQLLKELEEYWQQILTRRREKEKWEQELAMLPVILAEDITRIRKRDAARLEADAALRAVATGLEVLESSIAVKLHGKELPIGEPRILTSPTEVTIGTTTLRISPGGATSLRQAEIVARQTVQDLTDALTALGTNSVDAASEIFAKRQSLSAETAAISKTLKALGEESIESRKRKIQQEWQHAQTRRAALSQQVCENASTVALPKDLLEAKSAAENAEQAQAQASAAEHLAQVTLQMRSQQLQESERRLSELAKSLEEEESAVQKNQLELSYLVSMHGDDDARQQVLSARQEKLSLANLALAETTKQLAALQPDLLASDERRLTAALAVAENTRQAAHDKRTSAMAVLQNEGSINPNAEYEMAAAQAARAVEVYQSLELQAQALALLARLFQTEQKILVDTLTAPFAEKISHYLQCLFGPDCNANIGMQNREFDMLHLGRSGGTTTHMFEQLSGGAKEQVAAAARLAMAEILAPSHHGCLPIVFDDAFAYSDPERVQTLQRMLYRAAERGLQLVILTCTPADYAALGATPIFLSHPA